MASRHPKVGSVRSLLIAAALTMCLPGCAGRGHSVNGVEIQEGSTRRSLDTDTLARRSAAAVGVVTTDVGRGMAFVVDPTGYLISNRHVIEDADHIEEISFPALDPPLRFNSVRIVYIDQVRDLALLKVEHDKPLPHLPLASSGGVEAGNYVANEDSIMLLSRKAQLEATRDEEAAGLIAHLGHVDDLEVYNPAVGPGPYMEVSTNVQRGQSGGPVVDQYGRAVGVVTWMWKDQPGGFAIPIGDAAKMLSERPVLESDADHRQRVEQRAQGFLAAMRSGDFEVARQVTSPSHAREIRGHTVGLLLDSVPRELVQAYVEALEELVQTTAEAGADPFEELRTVIARVGPQQLGEVLGVERSLSSEQVMTFFFEFGQAYIAARVFGDMDVGGSADMATQRLRSLDAARSFALAEIIDRVQGGGLKVEKIDVLPGEYAPRAVVTVRFDETVTGVVSDLDGKPVEVPTSERLVLQMRYEWGDWYVAELQRLG